MTWRIVICLSVLPATHMPSSFLCPNPLSIWWLAGGENAGVKAFRFNRLRFLNQWRIGLDVRWKWRNASNLPGSPRIYPHMTTSWWRSPMRHLRYSRDDIKRLHKFSRSWGYRICCIVVCMQFSYCRNFQFHCAVLLIPFTQVVGRVSPSWLCQLVKRHLLLPKTLDAVLYCFGDCAHHPARFIIFAPLALLCIVIIFPILLIAGTWIITQPVSNTIQYLFKRLFGLPECYSPAFSASHIFLLLLNCCLSILNSVCCHNSFSVHVILDPLLCLSVIPNVYFLSSLWCKLLFGSQSTQCK